jgi:hypothetical protein
MERDCPFCRGQGRSREGYGCDSCNGTGDYDTMMLVRAYRLGCSHERNRIIAGLTGTDIPQELTFETIKAAVVDDVRRQRYEDSLEPGSIERKALEARVSGLLRERKPLLEGLGALAERFSEHIEEGVR